MSALMVQGTSSWAGKSFLTTALCRHFARRGVRVAPFKAQNMSNNARVTAGGGEIGVAQYLQARAAGVEPDVRMNPVLVKPRGDTSSQVVVRGVADPVLSACPWRERAARLWPIASEALASLLRDYELVVLEGAGSPAEINLADCDMTNLRSAEAADAAVLIVCDLDRGGAFAHLYGTWALLEPRARARVAGFVLNRFRGDPGLLEPAPERLAELTGVPTVGLVPLLSHQLPDEDGVAVAPGSPGDDLPVVAVVVYPTASNLDELKPLEQVADVRLVERPESLGGVDLIVLPGSKHVAADLRWLRAARLDGAIRAAADGGTRVLGVCGGLQMLGDEVRDAGGVDGDAEGLGLLPLSTVFERDKLTATMTTGFSETLGGPWSGLAGAELRGYEIRHGHTRATGPVAAALPDGRGWWRGSVLGIAPHGLFESSRLVEALLDRAPSLTLDAAIDELTDGVIAGLDVERVERIAGVAA